MLFISDDACWIREQTRDNDPDKISVRELLLAETSQSSPYPNTGQGFRPSGAILQQLLSLAEPDRFVGVFRVSFPRAPENRSDITLCYRYPLARSPHPPKKACGMRVGPRDKFEFTSTDGVIPEAKG